MSHQGENLCGDSRLGCPAHSLCGDGRLRPSGLSLP